MKRYDPYAPDDHGLRMIEASDGDYVHHDEAAAIISTYKESLKYWIDEVEDAEQRILELEAQLKDRDRNKAEFDEAMKDVRRLRMRDMGGEE